MILSPMAISDINKNEEHNQPKSKIMGNYSQQKDEGENETFDSTRET